MSNRNTNRRRLLTEREVEADYGIPIKTLRHWRYVGRGPRYLKIEGRLVRYRVADIERWLESYAVEGAA